MGLAAPYVFPASLADEREKLRGLLGSFWGEIFTDEAVLTSFLHARAQLDAQTQLDLIELMSCISRHRLPVFHTQNWFLLTLRESNRNDEDVLIPSFGADYAFGDPAALNFGQSLPTSMNAWTVPRDFVVAPVIVNRIVASSLTWVHGVDYFWKDGTVLFKENPFENEWVAVRDLYDDLGAVEDRELQLWVYRGQLDNDALYQQFGYVVGLRVPSSEQAKRLLNAVFDAIVNGPNTLATRQVLSAVCDVPLAAGTETVEAVRVDARALWVITDQRTYEFDRDAEPLVAVGDVVHVGEPLTNTLRFYEFNRGQAPSPTELRSLALGKGFLSTGFFGDLVFENKTVNWTVIPPSPATGNYTRMEFEIKGAPGDVTKFWDDVHAAGVDGGDTLAHALDTRAEKIDQPTAANLPTTVNPVRFLCENILRGHYGLAVVRVGTQGRNAPGLHHARILRKILPATTALLIYAELELGVDEIIMEGSGDETKPGSEETFLTFLCGTYTEEVDPADFVTETVRFRQIQGQCV